MNNFHTDQMLRQYFRYIAFNAIIKMFFYCVFPHFGVFILKYIGGSHSSADSTATVF